MSPRVGVVMCASNAEAHIGEAIGSILSQTFNDFELIVVENGSTDHTWSIVSSFSDPRVRAFRTEIRALPFNLNFGVLQTRAPLITRMDADDISLPHRLEKLVAYMDANPKVAVLGSCFEVFGEGLTAHPISVPRTHAEILRDLPFFFCVCHPSVIIRREAIIKHRGYGLTYAEDLDLWLRMSRDAEIEFANLQEVLLRYRVHARQSKGSRQSYFAAASILMREGFVHSDWRCIVGSLWMVLKYFGGKDLGVKEKLLTLGLRKGQSF